ncbi:MAG TPA: 2-hydroxyacid dehydrogenase [Gammaproteobacteria bacterium]
MKGVLLDRGSLDAGDLDLSVLEGCFNHWRSYPDTRPEQLAAHITDTEVVITNKVRLDGDLLRRARNLRLVCIAATGTNNVDLEAARERDIAVCNVLAYATPSVVEHVFTQMLALVRHSREYAARMEREDWQRAAHFCLLEPPIHELAGKTLGIVGYGELGKGVTRVARAFGMEILLAQRPGGAPQAGRLPLMELLPRVDVLSLHCPLTEQTRDLIGAAQLAAMKPGAILLNTARGGMVDETALLRALENGRLGGAAIDVLREEPPRGGNPLLKARLSNLIVTPHIAWASIEARQRLVAELVANVQAFQRGEARNRV